MNFVVNVSTGTDLSATTLKTFRSQKKLDWTNVMLSVFSGKQTAHLSGPSWPSAHKLCKGKTWRKPGSLSTHSYSKRSKSMKVLVVAQ